MKVEFEWRAQNKFYGIRLFSETNEEMADLERFKACELEPSEYLRIVNGEHINYLITFKDENPEYYPQVSEKQFFWKRIFNHFK
jgi:hypothetical protein